MSRAMHSNHFRKLMPPLFLMVILGVAAVFMPVLLPLVLVPTVLLGLVCRERGLHGPLRVESRLIGDSPVDFPAKDVEFDDERCVQVRDLLRAGTMSEGGFTYELSVLHDDVEVASRSREFFAVEPAAESRTAP